MSRQPEEFILNEIPVLRWGKPGGRAVVGMHGQFANKCDPVMAQCCDVIASQCDQRITFSRAASTSLADLRILIQWWRGSRDATRPDSAGFLRRIKHG